MAYPIASRVLRIRIATFSSDVRAATAAGFDRHLAKPVDFPQLMSAIKELVG